MARKLTAWLSIGSTYSYLTAMRIKKVVEEEDINLSIIPISIRQIMKSMDNIPFPPSKKTKVNYCLLYTSPSPRDNTTSRMPSSA